MLLNTFLHKFEEQQAVRAVRDHLKDNGDGSSRAEFLGAFLSSVFQPIVSLQNRQLRTIGFEAFIRPVAGKENISPLQYFDDLLAEDQAFVDRLCRDLHLHNFGNQAQGKEFISINIVPRALQEHVENFEDLKNHLSEMTSGEITSQGIMVELDITPELDAGIIYTFTSQLKTLGIGVSLENFDADCASISRIVHCRPDVVKFNRSWLDANLRDPAYVAMVGEIVKALHLMGARAHLERVESRQELFFALAAGFDRAQGYYIAQPKPDLERINLVIRD